MNSTLKILYISSAMLLLTLILTSCEKEVVLLIPPVENKYVIEGTIELDQIPFVLISQTRDYNQTVNEDSFNDFYLGGATVVVSHDNVVDTLDEICTAALPLELLEQVAELTGINAQILASTNVCGYVDLDGNSSGQAGKTYDLNVTINGESLNASTTIPEVVTLDSLWFHIPGVNENDSLGFAYAKLTDPETIGNAYRWSAKRINKYPEWADRAGEQKDQQYIAPLGSAYDDSFFNGLSFEFAYYRGSLSGSNKADDLNIERGFFKLGDTIAVKGAAIDLDTYQYVISFESEAGSAGNPFTAPSPIYSNINGGIGIWAGYASVYDTLICTP